LARIEQQRRSQGQVGEMPVLQADKHHQQRPPRGVKLLPAGLLRSRRTADLPERPGTAFLIRSHRGFGKFSVAHRDARTGRNPATGEPLQINASKAPKFTAGATLKATVAGKKP